MNLDEKIQSNGEQVLSRVFCDHFLNDQGCVKELRMEEIKSELPSDLANKYDNDSRSYSANIDGQSKEVASNNKHDGVFNMENDNDNQRVISNPDIGVTNTSEKLPVSVCEDRKNADEETDNDATQYFTCEDEHDERVQAVCGGSHREIAKILSPVQLIGSSDLCNAKHYKKIMNTLEEFQTQSMWDEHKRLTSCLNTNEINLDLKIVLFLEEGMAQIFQKHFSSGKKLFRKALQLCSQSKNSCLLQGRSLMFLGNAYRKEGPTKYGKALACLTSAQQNLSLVESKEDKAEINYFLGVFYLNMLSISINEPSKNSRDRIEKHYQAVYDYAMAESASRVREKIQRIFPLGMANFLLDGQTELARSRMVPEKKMKRAEDCLKYFIQQFPFDKQPITMQTDYCKSMSDLEYRKGNLHASQVSSS
jgi:hypothetical protein